MKLTCRTGTGTETSAGAGTGPGAVAWAGARGNKNSGTHSPGARMGVDAEMDVSEGIKATEALAGREYYDFIRKIRYIGENRSKQASSLWGPHFYLG